MHSSMKESSTSSPQMVVDVKKMEQKLLELRLASTAAQYVEEKASMSHMDVSPPHSSPGTSPGHSPGHRRTQSNQIAKKVNAYGLPPPPPLPVYYKEKLEEEEDEEIQKPKTGVNMTVIWPSPDDELIQDWDSIPPEPLYVPPDTIIDDMLAKDAARIANPEKVMNRVVYDSVAPPASLDAEVAGERHRGTGEGSAASASEDSETTTGESNAMEGDAVVGNPVVHEESDDDDDEEVVHDWFNPVDEDDETLVFESRFECANLRRAIQIYSHEYDLICKPDINTRRHTQWFYFSISNTRANTKYKFNFINMMKTASTFNQGMQPCVYSVKRAETEGIGWRREGEDICYYQNHIKRSGKGYFFTATMTLTFPYDHDTVFLAYCYPYTYTLLQKYLAGLERDPFRQTTFRRRILCQTLAGNNCDMLTITSFNSDPADIKLRKAVVISSRIHPGETNASWMMEGVLDYLTSDRPDAKILRDNYVFKIIPMLNPDGVIVGNYRCSLTGGDLNRTWDDPGRKLHPPIYNTKELLRRLQDDRGVLLYCDIHGHSRKNNVFMYGCENKRDPEMRYKERIFPTLLSQNSPIFSLPDCNFKVQRGKEATARVVGWRELGIINCFTMESSFSGANFGIYEGQHFNPKHWIEMGHYFVETILDYSDPDQSRVHKIMRELGSRIPAAPKNDIGSDSDSCGSDDEMDKKAVVVVKIKKKKKKRKKKKVDGEEGEGKKKKKKVKRRRVKVVSSSNDDTLGKEGAADNGVDMKLRKPYRPLQRRHSIHPKLRAATSVNDAPISTKTVVEAAVKSARSAEGGASPALEKLPLRKRRESLKAPIPKASPRSSRRKAGGKKKRKGKRKKKKKKGKKKKGNATPKEGEIVEEEDVNDDGEEGEDEGEEDDEEEEEEEEEFNEEDAMNIFFPSSEAELSILPGIAVLKVTEEEVAEIPGSVIRSANCEGHVATPPGFPRKGTRPGSGKRLVVSAGEGKGTAVLDEAVSTGSDLKVEAEDNCTILPTIS